MKWDMAHDCSVTQDSLKEKVVVSWCIHAGVKSDQEGVQSFPFCCFLIFQIGSRAGKSERSVSSVSCSLYQVTSLVCKAKFFTRTMRLKRLYADRPCTRSAIPMPSFDRLEGRRPVMFKLELVL